MADGNEGTPSTEGQAPEGDAGAQAPEAQPGTGNQPDEVTTLRSRNAGLDAKVTSLLGETAREKAAREAAEQKLRDYEAGKVNADEALRAQLSEKEQELAQARREAALARIEAKYPETFSVLGEAAASLTADQLAASEARFAGVPAEVHTPPVPGATNAPRTPGAGTKAIEDMSIAELEASLKGMPRSVLGLSD
jgi:hypothetical protein